MPKTLHPYDVIIRPLITEKATILASNSKYAFQVDRRANKNQVRKAVETAFNVKVTKVNTMNVHGKRKRLGPRTTKPRGWKKALVTLAAGETITIFEGV